MKLPKSAQPRSAAAFAPYSSVVRTWDCPEKVDTWLLVQAAFEAAARCSN